MSTKAPYSIRWWLIRHAPVINPDDVAYGSMDLDATFEAMGPRVEYLRACCQACQRAHQCPGSQSANPSFRLA